MRLPIESTSVIPALRAIVAVALALPVGACDPGDVEPHDEDPAAAGLDDVEAATLEIVENLRQAGYPDDQIEVDDDVVIVGGDAVVTLEASREMIGLTRRGPDGEDVELRQYRNINVISTELDSICVDGAAFDANATLSAGLDNAIVNYNAQNLSFDMTRFSGSAPITCDVVITAVLTGGSGGSAGFPSGGVPYPTFNIGSGLAALGTTTATHTITHQLGHCIGLHHTDCGSGCGAIHIPNTPSGADPASVMSTSGTVTGVLSAEDIDALHQLYGRDCCAAGSGAGCGNVPVNECVGAVDPYCNATSWDGICASEVESLGCGACPAPAEHGCCVTGAAGCENNVIEAGVCATDPFCCNFWWDGTCVGEVESLGFGLCDSNCCSFHLDPGCDDADVQACVCAVDSYCCTTTWDGLCVVEVETLGCSQCG